MASERRHCKGTTMKRELRRKEGRDAGQRHRAGRGWGREAGRPAQGFVAAEPGLVFMSVVNTS